MKWKLKFAALIASAVSTATADTYVATGGKKTANPNDEIKLVTTSRHAGSCVYADKSVKLGDTVIIAGADLVLVCASGPKGGVFYQLSTADAQGVRTATPPATK